MKSFLTPLRPKENSTFYYGFDLYYQALCQEYPYQVFFVFTPGAVIPFLHPIARNHSYIIKNDKNTRALAITYKKFKSFFGDNISVLCEPRYLSVENYANRLLKKQDITTAFLFKYQNGVDDLISQLKLTVDETFSIQLVNDLWQ